MKRGGPNHPKIFALAKTLGCNQAEAVGYVELLIHFTEEYAPTGALGKYPDARIAAALGRSERGGKRVIDALLEAGFLEAHCTARLIVHSWGEHISSRTKEKLVRRGESVVDSEPSSPEVQVKFDRSSPEVQPSYTRTSPETHPKLSQHSELADESDQSVTGETRKKSPPTSTTTSTTTTTAQQQRIVPDASVFLLSGNRHEPKTKTPRVRQKIQRSGHPLEVKFNDWWVLWWKHVDKEKAWELFCRIVESDPAKFDAIMQGTKLQRPEMLAKEHKYRPGPERWLGNAKWEDETAEHPNESPRPISADELEARYEARRAEGGAA